MVDKESSVRQGDKFPGKLLKALDQMSCSSGPRGRMVGDEIGEGGGNQILGCITGHE